MKNNNDLAKLINKYLKQSKKKKIFLDKEKELNAEEIRKYTNNLASNLYHLSLRKKKNLIIGILLERNVFYLISIFACWLSGATIVPLNKRWPQNHLRNIKKKLEFDYLLVDEKKFQSKNNLNLKSILKRKIRKVSEKDISNLRKKNTSPYIIFTSGSSGFQKGVEISSDGYMDYIKWTKDNFKYYRNLSPLLITAEMTFDITMGDIAFALAHNTSIVISSSAKNFFEHLHLIKKYKVEVFYSVPSTINLILDYSKINNEIKSIKLFISGGDIFNVGMIEKILENNPQASFFNVYGPTECTINVTSIRLDNLFRQNKIKEISIGRVFPHLNFKLVKFKGNKLSESKSFGELVISGNQIMKDYINKDDIKKDYFVYIKGKRYYRTGDLAELKKNILYLRGRVDDLIKIKGYRINPQEIDNIMTTNKSIIFSKTLIDKSKKKLITFVQRRNKINISNINKFISKNLPSYMVPSCVIILKSFPLGKSGKVDKKKLMSLNV